MANETKEKKITLDFSEELINLVREQSVENKKEKCEKVEQIKEHIFDIVENEITIIEKMLDTTNIHQHDEYDKLIKRLHSLSDILRFW